MKICSECGKLMILVRGWLVCTNLSCTNMEKPREIKIIEFKRSVTANGFIVEIDYSTTSLKKSDV